MATVPSKLGSLRQSLGSIYLALLLVGVILGQSMDHFVGSAGLIAGQSISVLLPMVFLAAAIVSWALSPATPTKKTAPRIFLGSLFILWIVITIQLITDGSSKDYTFVVLPTLLLMLWTKSPDRREVRMALTVGCLFIAALFIFAAAWPLLNHGSYFVHEIDWPGLAERFPGLQRWHAPFNGPAESAALGAAIIVWGLGLKGGVRLFLVITGLAMLFFGGNLAALGATAAGMIVLALFKLKRSHSKTVFTFSTCALVATMLICVILALVADPGLNGRVDIWQQYLSMWKTQPALGVGSNFIAEYAQTLTTINGQVALGAPNGHNLLIDTLARFGFFAAALLFTSIVVSTVGSFRSIPTLGPQPLAMLICITVLSLTETTYIFSSSSILLFIYICSAMYGLGTTNRAISITHKRFSEYA